MNFAGSGYTPGGQVDMVFARLGDPRAGFTTHADATGSLDDYVFASSEDDLLKFGEARETIFVTANDRTRIDAGQLPPESQFGAAAFTFTRSFASVPGRYVRGRRVTLDLYGWAFAAGKTAWLQFRRNGHLATSLKAGRLARPCGDRLSATVRVPRRLKVGTYRVVLSTRRHAISEAYVSRQGRVVAARSAGATPLGTGRPVARVGVSHSGSHRLQP